MRTILEVERILVTEGYSKKGQINTLGNRCKAAINLLKSGLPASFFEAELSKAVNRLNVIESNDFQLSSDQLNHLCSIASCVRKTEVVKGVTALKEQIALLKFVLNIS